MADEGRSMSRKNYTEAFKSLAFIVGIGLVFSAVFLAIAFGVTGGY